MYDRAQSKSKLQRVRSRGVIELGNGIRGCGFRKEGVLFTENIGRTRDAEHSKVQVKKIETQKHGEE